MPKYHVALSFAGEDRKYVEKVAAQLAADGVDVFYDKFEEATLWRVPSIRARPLHR
jgi:hypothetical protein